MRLLCLILLLIVAGCGKSAPSASLPKDTLIRLSESEARGLDPQMVSDLSSIRIASDQFEGLARFDAAGKAEAGLAENWEISADGLTWTFYLRAGLHFSDGRPIEASVFTKAFARIQGSKAGSPHASLFGIITRVETSGTNAVIISLKNPFPELPALLAHPAMAALPFHIIEAKGESWTAIRPLVTSGAYRLTDWQLNQQMTLAANPRWHSGRPATPNLIWQPMDDILSGMRLMLAGGAHISTAYPAARQSWLEENYPQLVQGSGYLATYYFAFNTRRPPFDNADVRRALSMAVDREWMAGRMIAAGNEPAWGLLPPSLGGETAYRPGWAAWPRPKRLKKARALLAKAGYDENSPLEFEIRFNSSIEHRRAAVAMATMWRDIGVEASLLNSEASLHFDALRRGDFDLARSGWVADLPAPENFLSVHRGNAGPQNYSGYNRPEYDTALDAALAEAQAELRDAKMRDAEAMLIADMPILPLYFYVSRALVHPDIRGWKNNIANIHPSHNLAIEAQ